MKKQFTLIFFLLSFLNAKNMDNIEVIDIQDSTLPSLIRLISENNDINIVTSIKARNTKISTYLKNIHPIVALEEICSSHNLWLQKDPIKNIYRIYSLDEYKKSVLKFSEEIKVYDLKYPNSKTISKSIFELFPARVLYYDSDTDELDDEIDEIETRLKKMMIFEERQNTSETNNLAGAISNSRNNNDNNNNDDNENSSNGGPVKVTLPEKEGHETFDLTSEIIHQINTADSIEEIRDIISNQGVFINSRIYLSSIETKNQMILRTGDREAMEKIDQLIKKLDTPSPMVLLEMKILAVRLDDNFESAFDLAYNDGTTGITLGSGLIQQAGAFNYSYINDKFAAALTLLEEDSKVRTLATPVILTLNREVSKFFNGNAAVPILTNFQGEAGTTVTGDGTVVSNVPSPQYDNRDIGSTLKVSPTINADRTVQLQISSIESEVDTNSATVLIASGDTYITQAVDTEKRRSFTGTVLAYDGKMIAVGGIIKETEIEIESGVPILRDIPLLDYFFEDKKIVKQREEILLLIKPYIIYSEEDHEKLSEELINRVSEHPNAQGQKDKLNPLLEKD
ncbi:hypothetical protein PQO03_03965 [Lentisphaera profundi]|uniref:Type II/III secretion system secretin-like domain-containing protein n=1 Tax=Lentisphaera profundi TaxID=1658616 RepID=A0ABY7VSU1_9BACT|nr:hypothetical protein [Lentisphaera profundi]WDE97112.1 hypothetical protein PQO03_03965 [Lentisphaera profundi]